MSHAISCALRPDLSEDRAFGLVFLHAMQSTPSFLYAQSKNNRVVTLDMA